MTSEMVPLVLISGIDTCANDTCNGSTCFYFNV